MPRLAPKALSLGSEEREELQQLVNRHNTPQQIALRAKIILLASSGQNNRDIARTLNISRDMARTWRNRWLTMCDRELPAIQKLSDGERSGTEREI